MTEIIEETMTHTVGTRPDTAATDLKQAIGNIAAERDAIVAALDYLFLGF